MFGSLYVIVSVLVLVKVLICLLLPGKCMRLNRKYAHFQYELYHKDIQYLFVQLCSH